MWYQYFWLLEKIKNYFSACLLYTGNLWHLLTYGDLKVVYVISTINMENIVVWSTRKHTEWAIEMSAIIPWKTRWELTISPDFWEDLILHLCVTSCFCCVSKSFMICCLLVTHLFSWFQVNFLSFNPYNEWILATASSDTTVGLFDMRKLNSPLHVLSSHTYVLCLSYYKLKSKYYEEIIRFMPLRPYSGGKDLVRGWGSSCPCKCYEEIIKFMPL